MRMWVVIYQTNAGFIYGWLCREHRISDVEDDFWQSMGEAAGKSIKCIAEFESSILDAYLSLYEQKED